MQTIKNFLTGNIPPPNPSGTPPEQPSLVRYVKHPEMKEFNNFNGGDLKYNGTNWWSIEEIEK